MQGNHDMASDPQPNAATQSQTTAAGLETWLSGVHAEPVEVDTVAESTNKSEPESLLSLEPEVTTPVNAAEALALSLATGTFSSQRQLTGPDGAKLTVDPRRDVYHFESTSLKPLAALLQQSASAWTPIPMEELEAARVANSSQPLERLRWYAGLIATPGILGRKLGRTDTYKLSRWPETEREFPRHFRIAKAMLHDPASMAEIVAASDTSRDEVVDYINASFASGRLETQATRQTGEAAKASRKGGLLARLNKPLFTR